MKKCCSGDCAQGRKCHLRGERGVRTTSKADTFWQKIAEILHSMLKRRVK